MHDLGVVHVCGVYVVHVCRCLHKEDRGGHQVSRSVTHLISLRQSLSQKQAEQSCLCPHSAGVGHTRDYIWLFTCGLGFELKSSFMGLNSHVTKEDTVDTCMPCFVPQPPPDPTGPSSSKGIILRLRVWGRATTLWTQAISRDPGAINDWICNVLPRGAEFASEIIWILKHN